MSTRKASQFVDNIERIELGSSKIFTPKQVEKILEFAVGYLDYGELDIVKDGKKIYILDVNNTPGGRLIPYLESEDQETSIRLMAEAFEKLL